VWDLAVDRIFRKIIIASVLLYTFIWFFPYFGYVLMTDSEIDILVSVGGYGATLPYEEYAVFFMVYDVMIYAGFVASSIGMFFFKKIAREAFSVLIVISLIVTFVSGMTVSYAGIAFLESILSLMDGGILALAYLSSLSQKFSMR
jgi:hypothetical protein